MALHLVTVTVRNQTGVLARISRQFSRRGVTIPAFVADSSGLHLVTGDLLAMGEALKELGLLYKSTEVHEVILEDRPGSRADLSEALARAGIDIPVAFGVTAAGSGRLYLRVDQVERAAPILNTMTDGSLSVITRLGRIPFERA
jgi:hypothetical protein